jgi:hypothetical protein
MNAPMEIPLAPFVPPREPAERDLNDSSCYQTAQPRQLMTGNVPMQRDDREACMPIGE